MQLSMSIYSGSEWVPVINPIDGLYFLAAAVPMYGGVWAILLETTIDMGDFLCSSYLRVKK